MKSSSNNPHPQSSIGRTNSSKIDKISKHPRLNKNRLGLIFGLLLSISGTAIAIGIWQKLEASVPDSVADISSYARPNTLTIKAADGSILKEIGEVSHDKLEFAEVPDILPQAFIASEDARFYEHEGIDFKGIARATVANIKAQGVKEGGSTITQQLARIAYLNQEKRIWRKLKEMKIASEIEANLSKGRDFRNLLKLSLFGFWFLWCCRCCLGLF